MSERAFIAEIEAEALTLMDRFDGLHRGGLLPALVKHLIISYDMDEATGVLRIIANDKVWLELRTPENLMAAQTVQFNAEWKNKCWHITTPDE